MEKDFIGWAGLKEEIHDHGRTPWFHEREVWWCNLGVNIGFEQDGKSRLYNRPVLVIRKFNRHLFLGTPLTTQIKEHPFYHQFRFDGQEQCALLLQARTWSSKRLHNRMGQLPQRQFCEIVEALREVLREAIENNQPPT